MSWIFLFIAGFMELIYVISLEKGHKTKKILWRVSSVVSMLISIYLLSQATQGIPLGVAYAIWTGLGSLFSVSYGIIALNESKRPVRLFFIACIVTGVIGLKIFGS